MKSGNCLKVQSEKRELCKCGVGRLLINSQAFSAWRPSSSAWSASSSSSAGWSLSSYMHADHHQQGHLRLQCRKAAWPTLFQRLALWLQASEKDWADTGDNDYWLKFDFIKDLFFLWFGAHEASKEGDKLSIASPNRDLTRRLMETRILQRISSMPPSM